MKIKGILFWCVLSVFAISACQPKTSPAAKAQDKSKWAITLGDLSNQPLPAKAMEPDYLRKCIDGTATSYWQSQSEGHAGLYLDIDLGKPHKIHGVSMDTSLNILSEDYPRGLVIYAATEPGQWHELVRDYNPKLVAGKVTLEFPPQEAQYLRLQLLAGAPNKWWSICEIDLME